jgi:flagellar biogenesis protein FliO
MNPAPLNDDIFRQAISIVAVFLLLGLALWALRRRGGLRVLTRTPFSRSSAARSLERKEQLPLTAQHVLHVVRFGGREWIVATHPQGCSLLAERPVSGEVQAKGAGS